MLKGTTRSGFAFEIPDARCRNMELVDALAAVDHGNLNELPTALDLLLDKPQKKPCTTICALLTARCRLKP